METVKNIVTDLFKAQLQSLYGDSITNTDPQLQAAARSEYGDYQANFAMRLSKELKQKPFDIANNVIASLQHNPIFKKLEVSGPGFINIVLSDDFLCAHLQTNIAEDRLGVALLPKPETVVVDYGGANVAKEMHVGHLRSAILGDAMVRILSFVGHNVIRQNHLGDWGTQFGMLIEYLNDHQWNPSTSHSYSELNDLYKNAKAQFDADEAFANRARERVVLLQGGDEKTLAIWKSLVDESKHHFQLTYDQLGLLLKESDACGESFYNPMLADIAQELEKRQIASESDGALVIKLEGFLDPDGNPLPLLIRKKDGGYLYATTDLAAVKYRTQTLGASRVIYVVDARQKHHFAMLFAAVEKAGWINKNIRLEHTAYGAVLDDSGKPFKTRSGEAVKLSDLLTEAVERAQKVAREKNPALTEAESKTIANAIGIGALKYADLRSDKIKDYVFNWEKMLAFDGNTAPYLQNAYVRIRAIFRKGNIDPQAIVKSKITLTTPAEHQLAIKLLEYPDIVYSVGEDLHLHRLCDYLYQLAVHFHRFYEHCPVLIDDTPLRNSRLALCQLTARTLASGLQLLGIDVVEKM